MTEPPQVLSIRVIPEYTVCAIPDGYPDDHHWMIKVEWRGSGWSVSHFEQQFSRTGARKSPPRGVWRPYNKKPYRFENPDEALALAKDLATRVVINGRTAADYMAWYDLMTQKAKGPSQ